MTSSEEDIAITETETENSPQPWQCSRFPGLLGRSVLSYKSQVMQEIAN